MINVKTLPFRNLLISAFFLRVLLITLGSIIDNLSDINAQYTDIDYYVVSDSAKHVLNGQSPFDRITFRYSPYLSYLLLLDHLIMPNIGKVIFSLFDILIGALIFEILKIKGESLEFSKMSSSFGWLFNPLSIALSTRGSNDSLVILLIMSTLYYMYQGHFKRAGMCFGLSVHFRIFPIIFVFVYLHFIIQSSFHQHTLNHGITSLKGVGYWFWRVQLAFQHTIPFSIVSLSVFVMCWILSFHLYSFTSIQVREMGKI